MTVPLKGPEAIILGGGGLLHPPWDERIEALGKERKVIAWGIGQNYHSRQSPSCWPKYLKTCQLVGLRDQLKNPIPERCQWVPCPTCMYPDYEKFSVPENAREIIAYSHYKYPIKMPDVPEFTNSMHDTPNITAYLKRIQGFQTVLTNSFHGAQWAYFSGRRVIIWKPFSTRFYLALPTHLGKATTFEEVKDHLHDEIQPPSLERYRSATRYFHSLVEKLLASWNCS